MEKINDTLGTSLKLIERFITEQVKKEFRENYKKSMGIVLAAYNRMQDDERGGVDYIFDIYNNADMNHLISHGMMDAHGVAFVVNNPNKFPNGHFTFDGEKNCGMKEIGNMAELLLNSLDILIPYVLLYITRCKEYQEFYEHFFVNVVEENVDYFKPFG